MSMWLYEPEPFQPRTIAEGRPTLADVYLSQFEAGKLTDNTTSRSYALEKAYDERIRAIQNATGEARDNPMRNQPGRPALQMSAPEREALKFSRSADGFNAWLKDMEKRYPDQADIIRAGDPVENDAGALARNMDEEAAKTFAAARGPAKWAAMFGGRGASSFYDPLQIAALAFGGGIGAAKTVAGRILMTAASEAAVNGLAQAATEPFVQSWRKEAGLPSGLGEAAKNIGIAALFGGVLGGAGRAAAEGLSAVGRAAEARALRAMIDDPSTPEGTRRALSGDREAAAAVLEPMRKSLPAETRGALDAVESERLFQVQKPPAARETYHDTVSAKAIDAAQRQSPFTFEPDPEQVKRIADQLAPETAARPALPDAPQPIDEFLMRRGGVKDFKSELAALGMDRAYKPFVGRLVRESGETLDNARLSAAEAGYFDHLYGTPDAAAEKSTIADLLDALDNTTRTTTPQPAAEADRRAVESLVHDIVGYAGPSVDDALIIRAAEISNAENLPPLEALDRVLLDDDARRLAAEGTTDVFPSDNDFAGGMDNPGQTEPDMLLSRGEIKDLPEDLEIPFFDDDKPMTVAALNDELERFERARKVVEACPL